MFLAAKELESQNPIDMLEHIFGQKSFELERRGSNEIVVEVKGKWDNMLLFFAWEANLQCLHMSCFMNIENRICDKTRIFELLALVNENLWFGHFSYWTEHDIPIFKHAVIIEKQDTSFESKLNQMVNIAITECEQMYPIFQAVLVQNIPPQQVLFASNGMLQ